jgi:hypothetical protein
MISVGPSAFIFTSCTFSSYTIIIVVQNKTKKSYAWKKSSLHVTSTRFKVIKSARSYFNYVTLHLDPKMFSCSLATHTYSLLPSNSLLFQHFEWVFFIIEFFWISYCVWNECRVVDRFLVAYTHTSFKVYYTKSGYPLIYLRTLRQTKFITRFFFIT